MKLSVIVPIYNVELFLPKCIDSLLHQGIESDDYEIVLVNDGSKDHSLDICNDYVSKYKNIVLINQENSGVGNARNRGLDIARGEYVAFVDSDDYVLQNGFGSIFTKIDEEGGADLIRFYSSYDNYPVKPIVTTVNYRGNADELLKIGGFPAFIWTFLYKRDFLNQYRIRFKSYKHSEDVLFISTVYLHNPSCLSVEANIYRYVLREGSAIGLRSIEHARSCVEDNLSAYEDLQKEFERSPFYNDKIIKKACVNSMNFKKLAGYSRMLSSYYTNAQYSALLKRIKDNSYYPIQPWNKGFKCKMMCNSINMIFSRFIIYKIVSCFFIKLFTPYILPYYRKHIWHQK